MPYLLTAEKCQVCGRWLVDCIPGYYPLTYRHDAGKLACYRCNLRLGLDEGLPKLLPEEVEKDGLDNPEGR